MEVIICEDQAPRQPSSEMCLVASSTGRTRLVSVQAVGSTGGGSRLRIRRCTSLGLLGSSAKELVANAVSDVSVSIFESWAGVKARERLDGVVEVRVTQICGYSEVHLLAAHEINNKI